MRQALVFILLLVVSSCIKEPAFEPEEYEAIFVEHQRIGCRKPVIKFVIPTNELKAVTGYDTDTYSAYGLSSSFWQPGRKLAVKLRSLTAEDKQTICDAMGRAYPAVGIASARPLN